VRQLFEKTKNPCFAGVLLNSNWLRGLDLNQRPSGYEPDMAHKAKLEFIFLTIPDK